MSEIQPLDTWTLLQISQHFLGLKNVSYVAVHTSFPCL